jgi:hypothetical protein
VTNETEYNEGIAAAARANAARLATARGEDPPAALVDGLPRLAWNEENRRKAGLALRNGGPPEAPRSRRGIDDWSTSRHESRFQFERYRFLLLTPLAAGYQNTGEEEYARAARDYIEEHLEAYPEPPYDDRLNLSIRLCQHGRQGWIGTLPHFLPSPAFDEAFVRRVVEAAREQVEYLAPRLPRHGNTRLFGVNCLLWCGLCLPFLPEAPRWRERGARLLNDSFHREINPDGSNRERDPHYLGMYVQNFSAALDWQAAFPSLGLQMQVEPVARMHDFAACSRKPSGFECGLHDGSTNWQGRAGGHLDGSLDEKGLPPSDTFRRRREFRRRHGLPETDPPLSVCFPDAGQAFLRTGWDEDAEYVTFDATQWAGAHNHLSRNSVQVHAGGRTFITDPGMLTYRMGHAGGNETDNILGPYGKSTRAHSTVTLNGWNQWQTNPDRLQHWHAPGYDLVRGVYAGGYWPGRYGWWRFEGGGTGLAAEHERLLLWLQGRAVIVLDRLMRWDEPLAGEAHQAPDLEMNWQFPPACRLQTDAAAGRAWTGYEDANLLLLAARPPRGAALRVYEGELDPPRGWVGNPDRDHSYLPAPQLSLTASPMEDYQETMATVLVPYRGDERPDVRAAVAEREKSENPHQAPGPELLRIDWPDGSRDEILWTAELDTLIGVRDELETDASLLHRRRAPDGRVTGGAAFKGTYCRPYSEVELAAPGAFRFGEGTEKA